GSSAPKKSGFSASLTAEMTKDGSGAAPAMTGSADAKAMTGSAAKAGSAAVTTTDSKPDPNIKPATTAPDPKSTEFGTKNDGNHNSVPEPIVSTEAAPSRPSDKRAHVEPGSALGAIKMDMEPNWDRDYETAGTISFVLKVPNSTDTRVFNFHYGYDVIGAPTDRDAYKKYLADQKVLNVTLDRQRGAAWYLEGTDGATNNPAFRMEVTYGGKRLVCYGSLYKDKESTAFGPDLRDKVVNAAKKICETLAL
ncbi:MAG TPA: hypothetical protein VF403_04570, partial [Kofleriaceae bacterium]